MVVKYERLAHTLSLIKIIENFNVSKEKEPLDFSEYCRAQRGMDAQDISLLSGVPRRTLYDWWKSKNKVVRYIVTGIVVSEVGSVAIAQSPSTYCREQLDMDADEVAALVGVPRRTFYDWWGKRNIAVMCLINGIKIERSKIE